MTKPRLPEPDLANICGLTEKEQWTRLFAKRQFRPPYSLNPTRRNLAPLLGAAAPLFPGTGLSREQKLNGLTKSIKDIAELKANLLRAEAILDFVDERDSSAAPQELRSHRISIDYEVKLSHDLLIEIGGKRLVPFFDLRKSGRLTSRGRDFVFAMNFHMIIDADVDYTDYGLVIFDYWEHKDGSKGLTPYFFDGQPSYSFEQLTDMIATTHRIWLEVLESRKKRSGGEDDAGPLFGMM